MMYIYSMIPMIVFALSIIMNIALIVLVIFAIRWSIINNRHTKQISDHLVDINANLKTTQSNTETSATSVSRSKS